MQNSRTKTKGYGVTAVLGPTNTGKTHMAIERMVAHESGMIGLPLRLLAREVYNRISKLVGVANVSLVTGEERITPPTARYHVCTVEAMPDQTDVDFVAVDEVQIATDLERGHFFTDRILNLRGKHETMLLGADTMLPLLRELLPGITIVTRPRMSILSYAGSKKITRMPHRSAIVAFSADEVYSIAELIRRERGGAAVVTGSLSPRTRNAQVALYQSGDVEFLVATDAIGMGLNLDVNHVAFAQDSKFDGYQYRKLTAAELGQVAGRAGRFTQDGTFGITSRVTPFDDELVEALETHTFAPMKVMTWRSRDLDFTSIASLQKSLESASGHPRLMRAPSGTDTMALENLARDPEIYELALGKDDVRLLWDVAKIPDYRRISPSLHAELLSEVYIGLARDGHIREDWLADLVDRADNTHGEIDALSARIASIRTCTYISNRDNWLENPQEWREKTRAVEDRLSDALHETLTKRFIDRRTSILMKRLKENRMLEAEIEKNGTVRVEGHEIGTLRGFRFTPEGTSGNDAKALNAAAAKVLSTEIDKRAERLGASPNSDIVLGNDGSLRWLGDVVAKLAAGETVLKPRVIMLADEHLTGTALDRSKARLERWISNHINTLLKPLADLEANTELSGIGRGIAFQLVENLGTLERKLVADDLKNLDQDVRGILRRNGVRFGAHTVFIPLLLKPAPTQLICLLWAIAHDKLEASGLTEIPELSSVGRTSAPVNPEFLPDIYGLSGFKVLGEKAVRIDILERLADLIRPTTMWKPDSDSPKPEGAIDGRHFYVTPAMMSILGATHEDMEQILKKLGYKAEPRLEADVKPASELSPQNDTKETEQQDNTVEIAPSETTSSPQEVSPPSENPAANTEEKPAASTEGEAINPTAGAEEQVTPEEPEEPKKILVWRYGGGANQKRRQFVNKPKPSTNSKPKNHSGNKGNNQNKHRGKPKDKPIDPDSPFAALAALKSGLSKNGKDG